MLVKIIPCPCGRQHQKQALSFEKCCARYLNHYVEHPAPDAESLMRSRYSAYTRNDEAYLRATWDERTCPSERITHDDPTNWLGLEVRKHQQDGDQAIVEFVARYKIAGKAHRLHEVSRFVKYDGKWLYVDGSFPQK